MIDRVPDELWTEVCDIVQETVRTFTLRAVSMQVRSKVRGMHCFVLKPKQDYLFNFPNTLVAPW